MVKLKTQLRAIQNEIKIHKKLLNGKKISQYEKDTHYDNLICAEAELDGMIIARDECLKEVLEIVESLDANNYNTLYERGYEQCKKELKIYLTKLKTKVGIPPKPKVLGILPNLSIDEIEKLSLEEKHEN